MQSHFAGGDIHLSRMRTRMQSITEKSMRDQSLSPPPPSDDESVILSGPAATFASIIEVHRRWQAFAREYGQNELIETETVEIVETILDIIRQSPSSDKLWKDLLREHVAKTSVRDFYLQLLFLPNGYFDPESSEGFDLWLEFIYGYNVRLVISRNVLFATDDGHIGLCPGTCEQGDIVGFIDGVDNLVALRHSKKNQMSVLGGCCLVNSFLADPITDEDRESGELFDIELI